MIFTLIKSLPNAGKYQACSFLFRNQITKPSKCITRAFNAKQKTNVSQNSPFSRYSSIFVFGLLSYLVYDNSDRIKDFFIPKKPSDKAEDVVDPALELDLNEIYERCAIQFLSDRKVLDALGLPIKITSNSQNETVRSISLRREGSDLFSFIAYDLEGSINSGVIYCKLKMDKDIKKFKTETIYLKLNKADSKNRREIVIYSLDKKDKQGKESN